MLTFGYTLEEYCGLSYNLNIKAYQTPRVRLFHNFFSFFFFIMMIFQCRINHFGRGLLHSEARTDVFE